MAGAKKGEFKELISPFLKDKMAEAELRFGKDSSQLDALLRQYIRSPAESVVLPSETRRHYESEVNLTFEGRPVIGVERLYRRTVLIEPTTVCAAHCRWCLRGQYPVKTMGELDITHATRYIGSSPLRDDVSEVLITGGDPLMSLPLLAFTLGELGRNAPNVRIVRIGSRVPFHDPKRINNELLELFGRHSGFRFEIGVNVCHPVEFWPESTIAIKALRDAGMSIYNQNPLLKGVNDNLQTLFDFYGLLRENGIEAHYLFHAIPMRGMSHHRTSLQKGLDLVSAISSSGEFSGRAKPRYTVMSDIGKIVVYDGTVLERRTADNAVLLQSGYRLDDRLKWNPSWEIPASTFVDPDGYLRTWYLDGTDEVKAFDVARPVVRIRAA